MKCLQERLSDSSRRRRIQTVGDTELPLSNGIINPKNSIPASGDGEQQVIKPNVFNLELKKPTIVLDENGRIIELDTPRAKYSKIIRGEEDDAPVVLEQGEQQVIAPTEYDFKPKKPSTLLNEHGEIVGVADPEVGRSTVQVFQKQNNLFRKNPYPKIKRS